MTEIAFTSGDLEAFAGISHDRRRYWDKVGVVRPTGRSGGRGKHRKYTRQDLDAARVSRELLERGMRRHLVAQAAAVIQSGDPGRLASTFVVQNLPSVPERWRWGLVVRTGDQLPPDPAHYTSVESLAELVRSSRALARRLGLLPDAS